jgi:hypothetical protein
MLLLCHVGRIVSTAKKEATPMTTQVFSPPSEPTRQDNRREKVKKILASLLFVLLLSWNVFLFGGLLFGGGWCFENSDAWTNGWGWKCAAPAYALALLTLSFTSGGFVFMSRNRYGLTLALMLIPTIIWFVWYSIFVSGGF